MALFGIALLAIGMLLFPATQALRPERTSKFQQVLTGQDVELVAVEGRSSMAQHCEPFPGKRVVLVTPGFEFLDMFTNWMRSAKPFLAATEQLYIAAMDDEVVAPIEAFMQDQELDYSVASPKQASALLEFPFGSKEYGNTVWKRPALLMNLLKVGCSVMYVDLDTVLMKDPFVAIEAAGSADFYIADDNPHHPEFKNLCTGFMFLHPSTAALALIQNWIDSAEGNSNQRILNHVLQAAIAEKAPPRMQVLSSEEFPPGSWVVHPHNHIVLGTAPSDPTMWHANWRFGNEEKINFFVMLDQWKPANLRDLSA